MSSKSKLGKFNTRAKDIARTSSPGKTAKAVTDLELAAAGNGEMNTDFSNADPSANDINLNGNSVTSVLQLSGDSATDLTIKSLADNNVVIDSGVSGGIVAIEGNVSLGSHDIVDVNNLKSDATNPLVLSSIDHDIAIASAKHLNMDAADGNISMNATGEIAMETTLNMSGSNVNNVVQLSGDSSTDFTIRSLADNNILLDAGAGNVSIESQMSMGGHNIIDVGSSISSESGGGLSISGDVGIELASGGGATEVNSEIQVIMRTNNNGDADANPTGPILITTGDKTAGTGDSADLTLATGTTAGGTQGAIRLTALFAVAPKLTSAPTGEAGAVYYDTTTNKLRCHNGTIWNDLF